MRIRPFSQQDPRAPWKGTIFLRLRQTDPLRVSFRRLSWLTLVGQWRWDLRPVHGIPLVGFCKSHPSIFQRSSRIAPSAGLRRRIHRRCGSQVGRPYWIQRQPHELASMATWTEPSGVHHGAALQSPGPAENTMCSRMSALSCCGQPRRHSAESNDDETLVRYHSLLASAPSSTPCHRTAHQPGSSDVNVGVASGFQPSPRLP